VKNSSDIWPVFLSSKCLLVVVALHSLLNPCLVHQWHSTDASLVVNRARTTWHCYDGSADPIQKMSSP